MLLRGQHGFFHLTSVQLAMRFARGKHFKSANTSPFCPSDDYFSKGKNVTTVGVSIKTDVNSLILALFGIQRHLQI